MKKWKEIRRRIRYQLIYVLVWVLIGISNLLPRTWWLTWCGWMGRLAYCFARQSRQIALSNLRRAYPDKSDGEIQSIAHRVFTMMGKNAGDVIRFFPHTSREKFSKVCRIEGAHYAEAVHGSGRGILFLTAHLGAFELIVTEMAFRNFKPYIIGTAMKDEKLTELLWRQRGKLGATPIERGKDTVRLIKALKNGGSVAILIDQDTRVKSVFVNFFGYDCATPIGAALLALRTDAAVLPIFIHMDQNHIHRIICYPEVNLIRTGDEENDIRENTQLFTSIIEKEIRKHPEQWLWIHERWKTKPGEEIK